MLGENTSDLPLGGRTVLPRVLPTGPAGDEAGLREMLAVALEQLDVASEELRVQHGELVEMRTALESGALADRHLFEHAPVGYVATTAAGTIQRANREAGKLLGVLPVWLVGKPLSVFVALEERRPFRIAFERLLGAQGVEEWPIRLWPRDGTPVEARMTASPVRGAGGEVVAVYWILRQESLLQEEDLL
jgi:PAS domain S-box-containing protein